MLEEIKNTITEAIDAGQEKIATTVSEAVRGTMASAKDSTFEWVSGCAKDIWEGTKDIVEDVFWNGQADIMFMVFSIAVIWLIMLGAEKPKRWLYWSWIGFWALRLVVFL